MGSNAVGVAVSDMVQGENVANNGVNTAEQVYARQMPGGGSVRVEMLVSDRGDVAGERSRGRVVIDERRKTRGARDTEQIVVEEIEGPDQSLVVDELFRIAQDNAAIARRILLRSTRAQRHLDLASFHERPLDGH